LYSDTKQVDYTCAFLHAPVTEDVYVSMPRGFQEEVKFSNWKGYYMNYVNPKKELL